MNIFYLDENPWVNAEMHCDKHCVKMILETAQMLCTAHRSLDGDEQADKAPPSGISPHVGAAEVRFHAGLYGQLALQPGYSSRAGPCAQAAAALRSLPRALDHQRSHR